MAKNYLVFQLQAPFSSWGESAVGEFRGTTEYPTHSALVGLLGAALGLLREDETAHAALRDSYGFAVGVQSSGTLLRDYHTVQVPPRSALKGRPHATRQHELGVPRRDLSTILSTRDYRQNASSLVILQAYADDPPYALPAIADALRMPRFTLYLGRKACPPAAPLWPQVIEAESAYLALWSYQKLHEAARQATADKNGHMAVEPLAPVTRLAFDERIHAGVSEDLTTFRKDRLFRRRGWLFGDRPEHIALFSPEA